MALKEHDQQFMVSPRPWILRIRLLLWLAAFILAIVGPYTLIAKVIFTVLWCALAIFYWRKTQSLHAFAGLRFTRGNLILVFNNGQEPELITLIDEQRILPWLVELHFVRENGRTCTWGIMRDAMDADSFRRLKVFINTRH